MSVKQYMTKAIASAAFDYISCNPEENMPKLLGLMESFINNITLT